MTARYLHHVTLTTGHVRRSPRAEVQAETIPLVSRLLLAALAGDEPRIPAVEPACTLTAEQHGRCLAATVWGPGRVPLVTLGVAAHSRCGARLWRSLHDRPADVVLATRGHPCPPEPWCAVEIHPTAVLVPEALGWIGDFERCLAWVWVQRWEDGAWPGID